MEKNNNKVGCGAVPTRLVDVSIEPWWCKALDPVKYLF